MIGLIARTTIDGSRGVIDRYSVRSGARSGGGWRPVGSIPGHRTLPGPSLRPGRKGRYGAGPGRYARRPRQGLDDRRSPFVHREGPRKAEGVQCQVCQRHPRPAHQETGGDVGQERIRLFGRQRCKSSSLTISMQMRIESDWMDYRSLGLIWPTSTSSPTRWTSWPKPWRTLLFWRLSSNASPTTPTSRNTRLHQLNKHRLDRLSGPTDTAPASLNPPTHPLFFSFSPHSHSLHSLFLSHRFSFLLCIFPFFLLGSSS